MMKKKKTNGFMFWMLFLFLLLAFGVFIMVTGAQIGGPSLFMPLEGIL